MYSPWHFMSNCQGRGPYMKDPSQTSFKFFNENLIQTLQIDSDQM